MAFTSSVYSTTSVFYYLLVGCNSQVRGSEQVSRPAPNHIVVLPHVGLAAARCGGRGHHNACLAQRRHVPERQCFSLPLTDLFPCAWIRQNAFSILRKASKCLGFFSLSCPMHRGVCLVGAAVHVTLVLFSPGFRPRTPCPLRGGCNWSKNE